MAISRSLSWAVTRAVPKITISPNEQQTTYQVKPTPNNADGFVAFGILKNHEVMVGKSKLRLAIMHGAYQYKSELIKKWIKTMADSLPT